MINVIELLEKTFISIVFLAILLLSNTDEFNNEIFQFFY